MRRAEGLPDSLPELSRYLVDYPEGKPAGAQDFFYWSLAEFGLKPVMRLNHVVIHETGRTQGTLHAMRDQAAVREPLLPHGAGIRVAVDDSERPGRGFYLITLNIARSDGLTGLFGGVVKSKVTKGSVEGLAHALSATRNMCERAAR